MSRALVTGGAKRVGREVALSLARAGLDVAITYRASAAEARAVVAEIEGLGRRGLAIEADFSAPEAAAAAIHQAVADRWGGLEVLVNNASIFEAGPLETLTAADFERNMAVNARAPLALIQRFRSMLAEGADPAAPSSLGRVVNFIDIHVLGEPLPGYLAYNCSKAALWEITKTTAVELAPHVTVNAIAPGVVAWADAYTDAMKRAYLARVPLSRAGTPDDAAAAVRYLACEAHYTTGEAIRLDGGRLLRGG